MSKIAFIAGIWLAASLIAVRGIDHQPTRTAADVPFIVQGVPFLENAHFGTDIDLTDADVPIFPCSQCQWINYDDPMIVLSESDHKSGLYNTRGLHNKAFGQVTRGWPTLKDTRFGQSKNKLANTQINAVEGTIPLLWSKAYPPMTTTSWYTVDYNSQRIMAKDSSTSAVNWAPASEIALSVASDGTPAVRVRSMSGTTNHLLAVQYPTDTPSCGDFHEEFDQGYRRSSGETYTAAIDLSTDEMAAMQEWAYLNKTCFSDNWASGTGVGCDTDLSIGHAVFPHFGYEQATCASATDEHRDTLHPVTTDCDVLGVLASTCTNPWGSWTFFSDRWQANASAYDPPAYGGSQPLGKGTSVVFAMPQRLGNTFQLYGRAYSNQANEPHTNYTYQVQEGKWPAIPQWPWRMASVGYNTDGSADWGWIFHANPTEPLTLIDMTVRCGHFYPRGKTKRDRVSRLRSLFASSVPGYKIGALAGGGFGSCAYTSQLETEGGSITVCSGNGKGKCTEGGICVCNIGYIGVDCSTNILEDGINQMRDIASRAHAANRTADICSGNGLLTGDVLTVKVQHGATTTYSPNGDWQVPLCRCYKNWAGSAYGEAHDAYVSLQCTRHGSLHSEDASGQCFNHTLLDEDFYFFMFTHQCIHYVGTERDPRYHTEVTIAAHKPVVTPLVPIAGMSIGPAFALAQGARTPCPTVNGISYGGVNCKSCGKECNFDNGAQCMDIVPDDVSSGAECRCKQNYQTCDGCKTPSCPWNKIASQANPCGHDPKDATLSHGACKLPDDPCQNDVGKLIKLYTLSFEVCHPDEPSKGGPGCYPVTAGFAGSPNMVRSVKTYTGKYGVGCEDVHVTCSPLFEFAGGVAGITSRTDVCKCPNYECTTIVPGKCKAELDHNGGTLGVCQCAFGWKGYACDTLVASDIMGANGRICAGLHATAGSDAHAHNLDSNGCNCTSDWTGPSCEIPQCGFLNGAECNGIEFHTLKSGEYYASGSNLAVAGNVCNNKTTRICQCERSMCDPANPAFTSFLPSSGLDTTKIATCESYDRMSDNSVDWCGCYLGETANTQLFNDRRNSMNAWSGDRCEYAFRSLCSHDDGTTVCGGSGTCVINLNKGWLNTDYPACVCHDERWNGTHCTRSACSGKTLSACSASEPCIGNAHDPCGVGAVCRPMCSGRWCQAGSDDYRNVNGGKCFPVKSSDNTWYGPDDPECTRHAMDHGTSCDSVEWNQNVTNCVGPSGYVCGASRSNWEFCFFNASVNNGTYSCECSADFSGTYCETKVACPTSVHWDKSQPVCSKCVHGWHGTNCDESYCDDTGGSRPNSSTTLCDCTSDGVWWPSVLDKTNVHGWMVEFGGFEGCRRECNRSAITHVECGSYYTEGGNLRCTSAPTVLSGTEPVCSCAGQGPRDLLNGDMTMVLWQADGTGSCEPICLNGGTSSGTELSWSCSCPVHWSGTRCETPVCTSEHYWDTAKQACVCKGRPDLNATDSCASSACTHDGAVGYRPTSNDKNALCGCHEPAWAWSQIHGKCVSMCTHETTAAADSTTCNCTGKMLTGSLCQTQLCNASSLGYPSTDYTSCECKASQWGGTYCNVSQCGDHGLPRDAHKHDGCTCKDPDVFGGPLCNIDKCAINGIGHWNGDLVNYGCVCVDGWAQEDTHDTSKCTINLCCEDTTSVCAGTPAACIQGINCTSTARDYVCECLDDGTHDSQGRCVPVGCNSHGEFSRSLGKCYCHQGWYGDACETDACGSSGNTGDQPTRWLVTANPGWTTGDAPGDQFICNCSLPFMLDSKGTCTDSVCDSTKSTGPDPVTFACVPKDGFRCSHITGNCELNCTDSGTDWIASRKQSTCVCTRGHCGITCGFFDPLGSGRCHVHETESWAEHNLSWLLTLIGAILLAGVIVAWYEGVFSTKNKGYKRVSTTAPRAKPGRIAKPKDKRSQILNMAGNV